MLGLSGGRDSAALAVFMQQYQPKVDIEYFFTDTGKELPRTMNFYAGWKGFWDAVPRQMFADILSLIARLRTPPAPA